MIYKEPSIYEQGSKFNSDFIDLSEYIDIVIPVSQTEFKLLYSKDLNLFYFYQTFMLTQSFSTDSYPAQPNFAKLDNLPQSIKNKISKCEFAIHQIGQNAPLATMYITKQGGLPLGIYFKVQQGQTILNGAYISPLSPIVMIGE